MNSFLLGETVQLMSPGLCLFLNFPLLGRDVGLLKKVGNRPHKPLNGLILSNDLYKLSREHSVLEIISLLLPHVEWFSEVLKLALLVELRKDNKTYICRL